MESRIEELLAKYWEGETTLDEENELKAYFKENPSLTPTGLFFRSLKKTAEVESEKPFVIPGRKQVWRRLSMAATIVMGITVGAYVLQNPGTNDDFEIDDPEEAYEIARSVLMKMSSSLNEGQTHSQQLEKLNKAEEIIKEEKL